MIDVQDYCKDKWGNLDGCSDVGSVDFSYVSPSGSIK